MIEFFTKEQFENALPCHKETGARLWEYIGFDDREHCYRLNFGNPYCEIFIRSSVGFSGVSRSCGKDSIRAWLCETNSKLPLAKKLQRWVTRVPGWQKRLLDLLREMAKMGKRIKLCPDCRRIMRIVEIKKGKNIGKHAVTCTAKDEKGNFSNHFFEVI